MTPQEAAEASIREEVTFLRTLTERNAAAGQPVPDVARHEESLRAQAAAFFALLRDYVGLTVQAARELASERQERLCHHPTSGHRADLSSRRVHVLILDGAVTAAARDEPHWWPAAERRRW